MKAMEAKMAAAAAKSASTPAPTTGIPGASIPSSGPGAPIPGTPAAGSPLQPGAPGGIAPYGAPGVSGMPGVPAADTFSSKIAGTYGVSPDMVKQLMPGIDNPIFIRSQVDVRFIGCINGVPKFVSRQTGQRVVFSTRDVTDAQKTGVVPTCR